MFISETFLFIGLSGQSIKNGAPSITAMLLLPWQGLPGPQGATGETGKAGEQVSVNSVWWKCNIHHL